MENLYVDETIYFREKYREDCASRYQFVVSVSKEIASSACSRICYEKRPSMLSSPVGISKDPSSIIKRERKKMTDDENPTLIKCPRAPHT